MAAAVPPDVKVGSVVSTVIVRAGEGSEERPELVESTTRRSSWKGSAKETTPPWSWEATLLLFPPREESPQVMTEPSSLSAAKAEPVEKIWLTPPWSWEATLLL